MAAISRAEGGGDGGEAWDGRSMMTVVFAWMMQFSEGGSMASLSLREPAFVPAASSSDAKVGFGAT